ncbi:MAG: aminopeptidase P family N-terminal domain-containing protein, partial [Pseudomonadota bacterium]
MSDMGLDGFFVPHEDEYQNEYLPDANERLAWATGFTGSAGASWVFKDNAVLFIDGRYTIQAAEQTPPDLFQYVAMPEPGPFGWIAAQDLDGKTLGYDPRLLTPNDTARLRQAAGRAGARIVAVDMNPIDIAWDDRPEQPTAPVIAYSAETAGCAAEEKRQQVAATLEADHCHAAVITAPASVAWAFNIRGGDVSRSPLPLSRAILFANGTADLFIDLGKASSDLPAHLGNQVRLRPMDEL